jgi:hypothetical protein
MGTETLRAHCGACAGVMLLHVKRDAETGIEYAYWYGCLDCGTMTVQRPTAAASAEDVVWVPAKQRKSERKTQKAEV